jgi:ribonuclease-3
MFRGLFVSENDTNNQVLETDYSGNFPIVGFLINGKLIDFENRLKLKINNPSYFERALTHRSFLQVSNQKLESNERLEFLGDALLGFIVAEHLFNTHTNVLEGVLTRMRSHIVNKKSLAHVAQKLDLEQFILMSYSAEKSLKSGSVSILADTVEAIIAAIYIDQGFEPTKSFILNTIVPILLDSSLLIDSNYKSLLMEAYQAESKKTPYYEVLESIGPDHDKEFTVGVYIDNELLGTGKGKNKKDAEQSAAQNAFEKFVY